MKRTSNTNEEAAMKEQKGAFEAMAGQAVETQDQALRTGLKSQEEAMRYWSTMLNQTVSAPYWQKQFTDFAQRAGQVIPMAEDHLERVLNLLDSNTRIGAELMKKAVEAAQTPVLAESQTKWLEFWAASMKATETNLEAFVHIGTQAIDSWMRFVRGSMEDAQVRGLK